MGQEGKTGQFGLYIEVPWAELEVTGEKKKIAARSLMVHRMAAHVSDVVKDGRGYRLEVDFVEWRPDDWDDVWWARVSYSLILLSALEAEIGEICQDVFCEVPDGVRHVEYGESHPQAGCVFERVELGWKRIK